MIYIISVRETCESLYQQRTDAHADAIQFEKVTRAHIGASLCGAADGARATLTGQRAGRHTGGHRTRPVGAEHTTGGGSPDANTDPRRPTSGRSSRRVARASAAFSLALVGCEAAHRRSRVRRHPPAPCGHAAHQEHDRSAHLPRLRGENQQSEAHQEAICDGGREPEGAEGALGARAALRGPPPNHQRRGRRKFREGATRNNLKLSQIWSLMISGSAPAQKLGGRERCK